MSRFRQVWIILLFFGMGVLLPGAALGQTHAEQFQTAISQYQAKAYAAAAESFEGLTQDGLRNGTLFYDIGNAYLKTGALGPAILWYERALRLIPHDPDLNFNLDYANTLVSDERGDLGSPFFHILFFWKDFLPVSVWQGLGIAAGFFFWGIWSTALFMKKPLFRKVRYGLLGAALLFSGTALYLMHAPALHPRAVILGKTISARSGFSNDSTELFVLHEGTTVAVLKKSGDYLKIRYAKDKIGWVHTSDAEII